MTEAFAFQWSHGTMVPLRAQAAERAFTDGKIYWLTETALLEPSGRSWRHQWAVLQKAWASLPEDLKDTYPDPDSLRKRALIEAGFYDETMIEVGDAATAGRMVASLRRKDRISHVRIQEGHVFQRTARSQRKMEKEEFERSKQAIFQIIGDLIGVDPVELAKEAE